MLIRYCSHFTHDQSLAEDLTQQALLESWLKSGQLDSQDVRSSWLIGIAHNICLRWLRRQKLEQTHLTTITDLSAEEIVFEDHRDLEQDFERHELAQFVEKALALLTPQVRTVLVRYYLESIPQAEIATQLGITVGAVEARLHRGRRALHHLLTTQLSEEATSFGLVTSNQTDWQQTHIWCPICGQRRLLIQQPEPPGTLAFRCSGCDDDPQSIGWAFQLSNPHFVNYKASLTRPKSILRRFASWVYDYYSTAASNHGLISCAQCGQQHRLHLSLPPHHISFTAANIDRYGFSGLCSSCGWRDFSSPAGFLQTLPAVQQFWQTHHRIHLIFRETIREADGKPAGVASFESITDTARLDIVFAHDTLQPIAIHTAQTP